MSGAIRAEAEGLLERINTAERAVPALNQTLSGTWMLELRPPGVPITVPAVVTYLAEGTAIGPTSDGNLSNSQGVWIRVADRKFLQTMYIFIYDEKRVLTGIQKVRISVQLSLDGRTIKGITDRILMDKDGNETATFTGGVVTGVRLMAEKTADFDAFLNEN
jgi:hypothetical protein